MSQIPEEPFGGTAPEEQAAAGQGYGASSQEAAPASHAQPSGRVQSTSRDKYLAIKNSMREREAENDREGLERAEMADRIRRMKSAKEHPEETPYERKAHREEPAEPKRPKKKKPSGKKSKQSAKKKVKKRRGPDLFPRKGDSPFEVIRKTVFLMSTTVFLVCLVLIGKYFWENYRNSQFNEEIRRLVYIPEEQQQMEADDSFKYYSLLPEAKILLEKNPEIVGWIRIPTTTPEDASSKSPIDYPVVQHTDPDEGNTYYLDKNIFGEYEKAGSIFLDYRNYFDYVVDGQKMFENSQNLIIYGHNMHDYSMFGSLKYYINEADYYDKHPIIELNSNYRRYKYKIFGMIIVDVDDTTETAFDYWNKLNFENEEDFYSYVNEVKRRTVRLTDVDVTYGDQILTLSTCNSTFSQGRLVVFGRLLRENEDLMEGCTSTENPNIKWPNSYYKWHKNTYDPNAEFVPYG